jgi:hypothetical protein
MDAILAASYHTQLLLHSPDRLFNLDSAVPAESMERGANLP